MQLAGKAGHWWVSPTSLPHAVGGGTSAPKRGGNQRQGGGGVSREPPPPPHPCTALWYSPQQTALWARVLQRGGVWGGGGARKAGGGAEGAAMGG